jgi:hypothetical protein
MQHATRVRPLCAPPQPNSCTQEHATPTTTIPTHVGFLLLLSRGQPLGIALIGLLLCLVLLPRALQRAVAACSLLTTCICILSCNFLGACLHGLLLKGRGCCLLSHSDVRLLLM